MKRSGFKKLTFEEALAKTKKQRERNAENYKMRTLKPKVKTKTKKDRVRLLKKSLWRVFSIYIRARYADNNGMVMTCDGKLQHWKTTHCGHLFTNTERNQSLGGNELWYDEHNFAPQTSNGNYYNADDSAKKYMLWAVKKYGQEEVDRMFRMKHTPRKFSEEELQEKLQYYKDAVSKLGIS